MQYPLLAMLILTSWVQVGEDGGPPIEFPRPKRVATAHFMVDGADRQITFGMPAPPPPADKGDERQPAQRVMRFNINTAVLERENFDRWLFADGRSERARRRYLEVLLERRIEVAALVYRLTAPQRAKLQLAGRGDIKRFFDLVEGRRREFEKDRRSFNTGLAALRRLTPLSQIYQKGPFGDGSLFAKTLHRINDDRKAGMPQGSRQADGPASPRRGG